MATRLFGLLLTCLAHASALSVVSTRTPAGRTLMLSLSLPIDINGQTTMLRAAVGQQVCTILFRVRVNLTLKEAPVPLRTQVSVVAAEFLITHGVTGGVFDALLPALEASLVARGCRNGRLAKLMEDMSHREKEESTSR